MSGNEVMIAFSFSFSFSFSLRSQLLESRKVVSRALVLPVSESRFFYQNTNDVIRAGETPPRETPYRVLMTCSAVRLV